MLCRVLFHLTLLCCLHKNSLGSSKTLLLVREIFCLQESLFCLGILPSGAICSLQMNTCWRILLLPGICFPYRRSSLTQGVLCCLQVSLLPPRVLYCWQLYSVAFMNILLSPGIFCYLQNLPLLSGVLCCFQGYSVAFKSTILRQKHLLSPVVLCCLHEYAVD